LSGNYVQAHTMFKESLEFWDRIGDLRGRTYALAYLGNIEINLGEYSEANHHLSLSLELSRATGDSFSIGTALNHLGLLAYKRGDYYGSILFFEQGIKLFELLGEQASLGWLSNNLAHSHLALDQFEQTAIHLRRAMQIARQSQIAPLMLDTLVGWYILQAQAGSAGQIASVLAGIAHHPASTQSVRERVSLALGNLGYSDVEQKRLAANAVEVSPEALIDQALKSGPTAAQL
jgi:tetratricopeptide (TPR) repeat protein